MEITSMYPKQMLNDRCNKSYDLILRKVYEKKRIKEWQEIFFELKEINKSINYRSSKLNFMQGYSRFQFNSTYGVIFGYTIMNNGLDVVRYE